MNANGLFDTPPAYTLADALDKLCAAQDHAEDLEALVRWLALPYMTTGQDGEPVVRTPIFGRVNVFTGEPLLAGIALERTWASVFGETAPPAPGKWRKCEGCGSHYVESVDPVEAALAEAAERVKRASPF